MKIIDKENATRLANNFINEVAKFCVDNKFNKREFYESLSVITQRSAHHMQMYESIYVYGYEVFMNGYDDDEPFWLHVNMCPE